VSLARAIEALTTGPAKVLAGRTRRNGSVGLVEGTPADLVVFDRSASWTVTPDTLASRGKNTPLLARDLRGAVLVTIAGGRVAYEAPDA
jgi:dihydroorotase